MTRRSSISIGYTDLIKWIGKQQVFAAQRTAGARERGVNNLEALTHDEECAKALMKMLKKCEPGKQADLFELFNQVIK
jgi:hypothetical protein